MSGNCTEFNPPTSKPYCITDVDPCNIIDPIAKERDAIFKNHVFRGAPFCIVEFENRMPSDLFRYLKAVTIWFKVEENGPPKSISLTAEVVIMGVLKNNPEFEKEVLAKFIFSRF